MTATLLATKRVEKPWGRHDLWPGFANPAPDGDADRRSLVPDPRRGHARTADQISVHQRAAVGAGPSRPTKRRAQAGYPRGKDECWVILAAEPGATIALGTKEPTTQRSSCAQGAEDGSIVDMLDWKPVKAGDFLYSPGGHDPRDRRRDHAGRDAAERRPDLSPVRLWQRPRAASRCMAWRSPIPTRSRPSRSSAKSAKGARSCAKGRNSCSNAGPAATASDPARRRHRLADAARGRRRGRRRGVARGRVRDA